MTAPPVPGRVPTTGTASTPDGRSDSALRRLGLALLVSVLAHVAVVLSGEKGDAPTETGSASPLKRGVAMTVGFRSALASSSEARRADEIKAGLPVQAARTQMSWQAWDFGSPSDLPGLYDIFSPQHDLNWYAANELDVRAEPLVEIDPVEPPDERIKSGHIYLEVFIDEFGLTDHVDVVGADPPGYYDSSAIKVFMSARWSPALKDGRFVRSRKTIEVCFGECPGLGFKQAVNPFEGGLD